MGIFSDIGSIVTAPTDAVRDIGAGIKSVGDGTGVAVASLGKGAESALGGFGDVLKYLPVIMLGGAVIAVVVAIRG